MSTERITLVIDGLQGPGQHVRVNDFLREIQFLLNTLKETEKEIHPFKQSSLDYDIVELRTDSPATVILETRPLDQSYDPSEEVVSKFLSIIYQVSMEKMLRERISYHILQNLASMATPLGNTLTQVTISAKGQKFDLKKDFKKIIEQSLVSEETYPGAMRGMLEAINLHQDANVFRIYPDVGPSKVTCRFTKELEEKAIQSIGHFVEVRGVLKYKVNAPYPHEISVDSIETFPNESELPSLRELLGVAPDATGNLLSEEFVRKLRDAST